MSDDTDYPSSVSTQIRLDRAGSAGHAPSQPEATIRFDADRWPTIMGDLRAGGRLVLEYDAVRLPTCRGYQSGLPAWDITANARFHPGLQLHSGKVVRHINDDDETLLIPPAAQSFVLTIPADARQVELWFQNVDAGGCRAWDSNGGRNYWFGIAPGALSAPKDPVELRAGAEVARDVVNVLGEGAVKADTFPDPAGQGTRLETRLVVVAWVRNVAYHKSVWVDVHVFDPDGTLLHSRTDPLHYQGPAGGGGDLFVFDSVIYLGSVATPGSIERRPEAGKVQYRLYAEMDGGLYTDGILHEHGLSEDSAH